MISGDAARHVKEMDSQTTSKQGLTVLISWWVPAKTTAKWNVKRFSLKVEGNPTDKCLDFLKTGTNFGFSTENASNKLGETFVVTAWS